MDKHICHLLYIPLNNAELTCDYHLSVVYRIGHLHDRILDICTFYTVQVLLSPMVSGWAISGRAGSVLTCSCCISKTVRGSMLSLDRDIERPWLGGVGVQHHSMTLIFFFFHDFFIHNKNNKVLHTVTMYKVMLKDYI